MQTGEKGRGAQNNVNVSLMRCNIKNEQLDAAVEMVNTLDTNNMLFSKSELVCRCIEKAIESVLQEKGLTDEQIREIFLKLV